MKNSFAQTFPSQNSALLAESEQTISFSLLFCREDSVCVIADSLLRRNSRAVQRLPYFVFIVVERPVRPGFSSAVAESHNGSPLLPNLESQYRQNVVWPVVHLTSTPDFDEIQPIEER